MTAFYKMQPNAVRNLEQHQVQQPDLFQAAGGRRFLVCDYRSYPVIASQDLAG